MANFNQVIIREALRKKIAGINGLSQLKREMARKFQKGLPTNIILLRAYRTMVKDKKIKKNKILEKLLKTRGIRSLSGVAVVSVLVKPFPCPGRCVYCPTERKIPKSYLSGEPAVERAILNKYDPAKQVKMRIKSLEMTGHPTDKIELIIIGGTSSVLSKNYQTWFIKKCFDAASGKTARHLKEAQRINEKATHRIIGLSLETRPDYINEEEIKWMRRLGATRVEIGVQSTYNDVLKLNQRGHTIETAIKATKFLKDAGFKVCYHMMPNLPGSNTKRDRKMFKEIFQNSSFRPDMLKIYPCVITRGAKIYELYKKKLYKPYSDKILIELLADIKKNIPYWVRIIRVIRDIPAFKIIAGSKISNLREIVQQKLKNERTPCQCIRCRQIKEASNIVKILKLFREDYDASDGKEIFLSFEDKNRKNIYAFLRLRIPSYLLENRKHFIKVLENAAIIREIHTYGETVKIGEYSKDAIQHKGLGKKLIQEAEKIAQKEFRIKKIAVISGVGVRGYWRKLGYRLQDEYMVKKLDKNLFD